MEHARDRIAHIPLINPMEIAEGQLPLDFTLAVNVTDECVTLKAEGGAEVEMTWATMRVVLAEFERLTVE